MKKLKKIFCIGFIAILIPFNSYSQYIPLLKNNGIWHVYHWFEIGWNETQRITGDTVINNQTYKILSSDSSWGGGTIPYRILREDTTTKKVYQYLNSVEFLLYDFSLPIGGIFNYSNPQIPSWTTQLRLDSITGTIDPLFFNQTTDWTTINPLRVYYFTDSNPGTTYQIIWVEGLGSLSGLLLPANSWGGGALGETLLCHNSTTDTIDYHFVFWWETGPCLGPLMGLNNTERISAVSVYPDPITSNEVIIKGENIVLVQFFNSMAENILNYAVAGTQSFINISNLPKGIYFLRIQFKNGQSVVRKVIKI
jgi:hypothetical protein